MLSISSCTWWPSVYLLWKNACFDPLPIFKSDYLIFVYCLTFLYILDTTLCDPIDGSPPDFSVPGILLARTLEWAAISFSNAWKWKVKVKSLSRVRLLATPWTATHQAPLSMGFSRQEYWSGVPLPSLSFFCIAKWIVIRTYISPLFEISLFVSFHLGHHRASSKVPWAIQ